MAPVAAVVMDIEGTTTSIDFVMRALYPYARQRIPDYVGRHRDDPEVAAILEETRRLGGVTTEEEVLKQLGDWMDEDRKVAPLKELQGLIWEEGYRGGELVSHLYPDVAPALAAWHGRGLGLYIYSSGSAHAQRLIYGHTVAGDLLPLFSGFFDTRVGHKRETASYRRIAGDIGLPPGGLVFLSDVREELDAARRAGWQTVWLTRDGPPPLAAAHRRATRFDQIPF